MRFFTSFPPTRLSSVSPQLKQPDKAAAAAHTYFQANPEHVEMGKNLEQYKDLQGVEEAHFVDREARPHQVFPGIWQVDIWEFKKKLVAEHLWSPVLQHKRSFTAAVKLYDKGDFEGSIALFEEALVEYYKADMECRALCQWPQKFEGYDYLRYRYSLYEVISGKTRELQVRGGVLRAWIRPFTLEVLVRFRAAASN